jgi:Pyruvate/2-oxoacid:ferredoxin oxidoreductase gamma subunit
MPLVIEQARPPRIVIATGMGGQGVQLASQVLAGAAMAEGREVMLVGSYGGMMRGGNTEATVVIGDGPVDVPPVAPTAWAGLVMHHAYLEPLLARLTPESVVFVNSSVVPEDAFAGQPGLEVRVPAVDLAREAGGILAASMVLLGALAAATGLVGLDALLAAVDEAIPAYRSQHVALNHRALTVGFAVPSVAPAAWPPVGLAP